MAISRYWRLTGFATTGNDTLELSEARIYEGGVLADASATLTAAIAPASGAVADLRDGAATGIVSWPFASYSAPAFALVWDFGAGLGVDKAQLRLGSGSNLSTFSNDIVLQYSTDGVFWSTFGYSNDVLYPGDYTLTPSLFLPPPDIYSNYVELVLHGNGYNGSTSILDSSKNKLVPLSVGSVVISTAVYKFGNSSLYFPKGSPLVYSSNSIFNLNISTWTMSMWFFEVSGSGGSLISRRINGWVNGWVLTTASVRALINGAGFEEQMSWATPAFSQWHKIEWCKNGTTLYVILDNVLVATKTGVTTLYDGGGNINFGQADQTNENRFVGYIDDFVWTPGVCRQTGTHAAEDYEYLDYDILVTDAKNNFTHSEPSPQRMLPAIALPDGAAYGFQRESPFFDAQFGGTGTITGTVKEKALPDNTPLHRRVLLMDQRSQVVFRETWSDAVTGVYTFPGVKTNTPHTVLAYDYTGTYRAVIADNILATP